VRTTSYYVKAGILATFILLQSFYLSQLIIGFVRDSDIFSVTLNFSIQVVLLMLLIIYTFALTIGGWKKYDQYVIILLPVTIAVFLSTMLISTTYATIITLIFALLLAYDIYKSTKLKNLLLKPEPKMILRFSTRGLLFLFSIMGGVLVLLNVSGMRTINVGQMVGEFVAEPLQNIVESQVTPEAREYTTGTINYREVTENQINTLIRPYTNFVNPIIALLTFGLFQLYASVAYIIYILTIDILFWIAKRLKFFTIETTTVEQEQLKF
jgi:hypothetical protein